MLPISDAIFEKKKQYFFWSAFAILCYYFYNSALLSQLSQPLPPPLIFPSIDNTYWVVLASGIYHFVIQHAVLSVLLDISLMALPLLILILPNNRILFCAFFVLISFYFITQNIVAAHHFHSLVGVVFLAFVFCFKGERFEKLWQAVRYYTLFVFVSAALWKIARGHIFEPNQMANILKAQHAQFLFEQSSSIHAIFIRWLIENESICKWLFIAASLVQLIFGAGFFTKKVDYLLLNLMILFVVLNYAVMRIVSFELLVLGITLLSNKFWEEKVQNSPTLQSNFTHTPAT